MSGTHGAPIPPKCGTEGVEVWNWGGESVELRGWYPFASAQMATTYDPYFPSLPSHPPYGGVAGAVCGPSTLYRLTTTNRAGGLECAAYPDKREGATFASVSSLLYRCKRLNSNKLDRFYSSVTHERATQGARSSRPPFSVETGGTLPYGTPATRRGWISAAARGVTPPLRQRISINPPFFGGKTGEETTEKTPVVTPVKTRRA